MLHRFRLGRASLAGQTPGSRLDPEQPFMTHAHVIYFGDPSGEDLTVIRGGTCKGALLQQIPTKPPVLDTVSDDNSLCSQRQQCPVNCIVTTGHLLHANPAMQTLNPQPWILSIPKKPDTIKLDSHSVSQPRVPSSHALAFLDSERLFLPL